MATIDKRGDVYRVQIRKRGHATINQSFKLKRDAAAFVSITEGELTSGSLSVPGKQTLNQAIDAYIEHRASWKQRQAMGETVAPDLTEYELGVLEWWRAQLGTERLAMIRQPAFKRCRDLLKEMDVTVATVNRRMSLISAVVTLALDNGWVTVNTARITAISEKSSQRVRLLTDTEQSALMKACNASEEPCLADFMITAMGTGVAIR